MTNQEKEAITTTIKKLLRLADEKHNPNVHERDVALRKANKLMAEHNLTFTLDELSSVSKQIQEFKLNTLRLEPWINRVLSAITKLYFTDFFMTGYRKPGNTTWYRVPVFIGTSENIAVTIEIATWVINSIIAESNSVSKEVKSRRAFRLGASAGVRDSANKILAEENAKNEAKTAPLTKAEVDKVAREEGVILLGTATESPEVPKVGTSLMVIRDTFENATKEYLDNLNLKEGRSRTITVSDNSTYSKGKSFGAKIGLQRQLGQTKRIGG